MTLFVLQQPENPMPEALDEIPRYKCDTCGAILLTYELDEHTTIHGSKMINIDARIILRMGDNSGREGYQDHGREHRATE